MNTRFSYPVVILAVFILLFLVGYWFLLIPKFREMSAALEQLTPKMSSQAQKATDREQRLQEIARIRSQAELLLPPADKQYDLSVQLEAAAKNSGVVINGMTINAVESSQPKTTSVASGDDDGASATTTAPAPAASAKKITVSMAVTGSYTGIQQWVQRITSLHRFIQIDQLTLTSATSTQGPAQVGAQITAFAYYLPSTSPTPTPTITP